MKQEPHEDRDDWKVWLTGTEVEQLLATADSSEERIAFGLVARSGLRVAEVVDVKPGDVVAMPAGERVRVRDGKGGKYREAPVPQSLFDTARAYGDGPDADEDTRWSRARPAPSSDG